MGLPVTSGLVVNFDAGTIAQGDNTAVASWTPAAGSETAAAAQATSGQRPTFRTNRINGLPAVVFTTAGSSNLDTGAWGVSQAVPNTAFVVAKITNTAADANLFSGRSGVFNYLGVTAAGGQMAMGAGVATEFTYIFTPGSTFHLYCVVYNGASSRIYADSAAISATGTTSTAASSNMPGMRIGSTSAGSANYPDAEIAEIAFYHGALADVDILAVQLHLNAKWGLGIPTLDLSYRRPPQPYTSRRRAANW